MTKTSENNPDALPNTADGMAGASSSALEALIRRAADPARGLPPVERWNPAYCGEIDMEIRRDGTWYYMGTPIGRERLVRLFSTVLRKDADGRFYLVTPVEKVAIRVEDAPFLAVEMHVGQRNGEQVLTFRTNVGDIVEADSDHPLLFQIEQETEGLKPYLLVRGRLQALLARPVMHELVSIAEEIMVDGQAMLAIRSHGEVFPMLSIAELQEQEP